MDQLRILAKTPYHPNWPFAAHTDTNTSLAAEVKKALINLDQANLLNQVGVEGFTDAEGEQLLFLKEQVEFE
jgi:ABC-type phosphate/phosphonate transport system substrate-binding protein